MIIAVDTGGTKTLVGRFSSRGTLVKSKRFATPKEFQEYLDTLLETINDLAGSDPISALSLALPGQVKDGSTLNFARNIGWIHDINLKALLKTSFDCPIFIRNDASLAGLTEIRHLSVTPTVGLYITVSTGIGTGLIIHGKLPPEWAPSEGGQIVLERDGVFATWESFASGNAIHQRYGKYGKDIHSKKIWHEIAKDISRGIVALTPILHPEVIVIGGSMGAHFDKYETALSGILKEQLPPEYIPKLLRANHPDQAVIYGCYLYATEQLAA